MVLSSHRAGLTGHFSTPITPIRPSDLLHSRAELVNCTPLKKTKLGEGYFHQTLTTYYNQRSEIVGTNLYILYRYH